MDNKEQILDLFYNSHLKQTEIAKIIGVSTQYDLAFAKWNRQMFKYDKKSSDLVLKRNIVVSCDLPKRVSNIVHASTRKAIC